MGEYVSFETFLFLSNFFLQLFHLTAHNRHNTYTLQNIPDNLHREARYGPEAWFRIHKFTLFIFLSPFFRSRKNTWFGVRLGLWFPEEHNTTDRARIELLLLLAKIERVDANSKIRIREIWLFHFFVFAYYRKYCWSNYPCTINDFFCPLL